MKKLLLISLIGLLTGCDKIPPPSDAAIAAVSQNCTAQHKQVDVSYNGFRYDVLCK